MKKIGYFFILTILFTLFSFGSDKRIVVNLNKQEAYAYEGKVLVYKGWISSGQSRYKTPVGRYRVLQKDREHISNKWPKPNGGAKMPYMLRVTWSGIALHAGYTPSRPASHGCIRLQRDFAKRLFDWTPIGTRVIIKGKAPKRVARRGRGFVDYIALSKAKYKKRFRLAKLKYKRRYLSKVTINKKRKRLAKVSSKRKKLVRYYARFSHKKLNRMLLKSYRAKKYIVNSSKYSKNMKLKKLQAIKRLVSILKDAKRVKYKRYKINRHKKIARRYRRVKKLS